MTTIIENEHIKVRKERILFPSGQSIDDYFLVEKKNYVAIVPFVGDRVLLVKQYRPGIKKVVWNIPMGFIDASETDEQAATRELLEETGYEGKLELLGALAPAPGFYTSLCHLFVARGCRKIESAQIDIEISEVDQFAWDDALKVLRENTVSDMTSVAGLLLARTLR